MPLSEDLTLMEAFVSVVAAGEHELTAEGAADLRTMLAHAAEVAAWLEDEVDRLMDRLKAARQPATIPTAALAEGLRSGKVVRLAAVRLARSPELEQPGWMA